MAGPPNSRVGGRDGPRDGGSGARDSSGTHPYLQGLEFDPNSAPMALLEAVSTAFANALNQVNRIGGADVPIYDPELGYGDVFENAGYGPATSQALGIITSVLEPGPGEMQAAMRLLPDMAALLFVPGGLQKLAAGLVSPDMLGAGGQLMQHGHGTMGLFDRPRISLTGQLGPGHYTAPIEAEQIINRFTQGDYARVPRWGAEFSPNIRLESPLLTNPINMDLSGTAPIRLDPEAMGRAMTQMEEHIRNATNPSAAQDMTDAMNFARRIVASGGELDANEWSAIVDPFIRQVGGQADDAPDQLVAELSRGLGIDGIIQMEPPYPQTVTFRPGESLVTHTEDMLRWLRGNRVPESEIGAAIRNSNTGGR